MTDNLHPSAAPSMPPYARAILKVMLCERDGNIDPVSPVKGRGGGQIRSRDLHGTVDTNGSVHSGRKRGVEIDLEPVAGDVVCEEGLVDDRGVAGRSRSQTK